MKKHLLIIALLVTFTFSNLSAFAAPDSRNTKAIAQVKSGQRTTANAAWWGFNKADSTKALQAAIDSGAKKVIVPDTGSPWIVNTAIDLASNQTIVFEKGVVVLAKKGKFHKKYAFLFFANNKKNITLKGYGATFRMQKKDYDSTAYTHSEWRHALCLQGCQNVKVLGLRIENSGGDGIYIGKSGAYPGTTKASEPPYYCKNIVIKDVVLDNNYRQGVSVITVDGLLMENVEMSNTSGTAPMAGIDFEPNNAGERLTNIVLRNCITRNNKGGGVDLAIFKLDNHSIPVSIRFEHCQFVNEHIAGIRLIDRSQSEQSPGGKITFSNCLIKNSRGPGIIIQNKPAAGPLHVTLQNCQVIDAALKHPSFHPIQFLATNGKRKATEPVGGVVFKNCVIQDSLHRHPIGYTAHTLAPLSDITGTLIFASGKESKKITLSPSLLKKWIPDREFVAIAYIAPGDTHFKAPAQAPIGQSKFRSVKIRGLTGPAQFAFFSPKGKQVKLTLKYEQVGRYSGKALPIKLIGPDGKLINTYSAPFKKNTTIQFTALKDGLYQIHCAPGRNCIAAVSGNVLVNIMTPETGLGLFKTSGAFYFWVPKGTKQFAIQGEGQYQAEGFRMIIRNPAGQTVRDVDNIVGLSQIAVKPKPAATGKIWQIQIKPGSSVRFEDLTIKLLGIPPLLVLTKDGVVKTAK